MFTIEMIAAGHGDCLWIEYGDPNQPHRLLIDGGTAGTFKRIRKRIKALSPEQRHFELLVVTHIDADHIAGVLKLLDTTELGVTFGDIWFNGFRHLPSSSLESLGIIQGERLTDVLCRDDIPWNAAFDGGPIFFDKDQPLPSRNIKGGLKLTVLSPTQESLGDLRGKWEEEARKAGLDPNDPREDTDQPAPRRSGLEALGTQLPDIDTLAQENFSEDGSEANGSSIALMATYDGKRVLLSGDAFASVLQMAFRKLVPEGQRLKIDAFKIPHHGSKYNVSKALLDVLDCRHYLVSTNGAYFKHPDDVAIARVIKYGGADAMLCFNYTSKYNDTWSDASLQATHGYSASYPVAGEDGWTLKLSDIN